MSPPRPSSFSLSSARREDFSHTPCYCEENVLHMCQMISSNSSSDVLDRCSVVFVSNARRAVPLWRQRAAAASGGEQQQQQGNGKKRRREESPPPGASAAEEADEGLVLWDYHVFLVAEGEGGEGSFVLDLDTTLPFPCRFSEYATLALRGEEGMAPEYHRYFRVVRAREFIRRFSSDRSHMLKEGGGDYVRPPPPLPATVVPLEEGGVDIQMFISMDPSVGIGEVVDRHTFVKRFNKYQL